MKTSIKKKTFITKTVDILTNRMLFSILYLVFAVMWYFPTLGGVLDYPKKILFVWGIALIGYDLLKKRICFSGYKSLWLVLFSALYIITILFNMDRLYSGIKHLIYNSILLFVIYPQDLNADEERQKNIFVAANDIIIAITFIAGFISIVMFAFQYTHVFSRGETLLAIGVYYNRLHGVYTSANIGALFSVVSICLSGITYALNKNHFLKFKWFYVINSIVQFMYYSATLSKGGYLAIATCIVTVIIIFVLPYLLKNFKTVIAVMLAMVCLAASLLTLHGATFVSRKAMTLLPKAVSVIDFNGKDKEIEEPIKMERAETDDDITNGRLTIWAAGLALWKEKPLVGIAEADVYNGETLVADIDESKLTKLNISELKRVDGYMHNAVIQILVYSGILGLLIFAIFAVNIAKKYIISLKSFYGTSAYAPLAAIFVLLASLLSQVVSESHILFCRQDPHAIIFWLYLGYGIFFITKENFVKSKNDLFLCDTPYQVVNSVNLAKSKGNADVYIYSQLPL